MKVLDRSLFCVAPFLTLNTSADGNVRFCCRNETVIGDQKNNRLADIWNSEAIKRIRMDFLRGVRTSSCSHCWQVEAAGAANSWRRTLNSRFGDKLARFLEDLDTEDGSLPFEPRFLELSISNLCNLRCRMCSPGVSSNLASIWKHIEPIVGLTAPSSPHMRPYANVGTLLDDISACLPFLEEIYIYGGEPLIEENVHPILDLLLSAGDRVRVAVSSKLTRVTGRSGELLAKLNSFNSCSLSISIDGPPAINEYVRTGLDTKRLEQNVVSVRELCPNVGLSTAIAVSAMNVLYWPETISYIRDLVDPEYYTLSMVVDRPYLTCQILPQKLKKLAERKIAEFNEHLSDPRVDWRHGRTLLCELGDEIIRFIRLEDTFRDQWLMFCTYIDKLDEINRTHILDAIPEFAPYWLRA
jgi:MoaA/NifB/PqqE/SkfB family radical SAM enzyme